MFKADPCVEGGYLMKKHMSIFLILLCLLPACALAAPELSGVLASDISLISGMDGWYFDFNASEGGTLGVQLLSGETGEAVYDVGAMAVEAGSGRMSWNGILSDGSKAEAGDYMAQVQLRNFWGEESAISVFALHIFDSEAERSENTLDLSTLAVEEAAVWEETVIVPETVADEEAPGVPVAKSFWEMLLL